MPNNEKSWVKLPEGRLSFPKLFEPAPGFNGGEPKYETEVLIPKSSPLNELKSRFAAIVMEKFPDETKRPVFQLPIKDGDSLNQARVAAGKDPRPELEGMNVVKARSKQKPPVIDLQNRPITSAEDAKGGFWAQVVVSPFYYSHVGGGLSMGLDAVQITRKDTPFGSAFDLEDAFGPVQNQADGMDPELEGMFA